MLRRDHPRPGPARKDTGMANGALRIAIDLQRHEDTPDHPVIFRPKPRANHSKMGKSSPSTPGDFEQLRHACGETLTGRQARRCDSIPGPRVPFSRGLISVYAREP